jgi:enamine deaminase RidA (YjgF/YER057c/UK114 family)
MAREIVNPQGMAPPPGYSYAIKKSGTPVFIAGQVALDAAGRIVGEGDVAVQTEQVFQNLKTVVEACGGTLADIVKLNIYATAAAQRPAIAAARQRWFPEGQYPASTYVVVAALAAPVFLVEIEAVAMID